MTHPRVLLVLSLSLASCKSDDTGAPSPSDCEDGYAWDGEACVDIDECAEDNGGCGDSEVWSCENQEGDDPICEYDCAVDHASLVLDASEIDQGGSLPSLLVVHGEAACPLVVDEQGHSLAAHARYGEGRVLHWGHEGMLSSSTADAPVLLGNALRWAGKGDAPAVGVEAGESDAGSMLESLGFTVADVGIDDLSGVDVLVTTSYPERSEEQAEALLAWIEAGGGLVQGGHAWWWAHSSDGEAALDYPGNALLNQVGITVTGSYDVQAGQDEVPAEPPSPLLHAGRALEAVERHLDGSESLSDADQVTAAGTVTTAVTQLPLAFEDYYLPIRDMLERLDPVAPTADDPVVPEQEPIEALVVAIEHRFASELPPDEVWALPSDFPGEVDPDAERVTATVTLDASYEGRDSAYAYSGASTPVWRSTGLYVPPGELVTVTVPAAWIDSGLDLQIGAWTDTLWHLDSWSRHPEITRIYELDAEQVAIASAFGGPLYLRVPGGTELGSGELEAQGVLVMPRYVHGETDTGDWDAMLTDAVVPSVELESDRFVLTLALEDLSDGDPALLMDFWDAVLDADADLAGIDRERVRPERFAVDRQISAGWMHSGYPIMGYAYGDVLSDGEYLWEHGDWGAFHELGHNHQFDPANLPGTVECTVNLWSVYASETVVGMPRDQAHTALEPDSRAAAIQAYVDGGLDFEADWNVWTCLETYLQLQEAFGWELYTGLAATYLAIPSNQRPSSDQDKIDLWVVESSLQAGLDLTDFDEAWGVPFSEGVHDEVEQLEPWTDHPMAE